MVSKKQGVLVGQERPEVKSDSGLINYKSRTHKRNHVVITGDFVNMDAANEFKEEMKKVIRRMNHLSNKEFSFKMHLQV